MLTTAGSRTQTGELSPYFSLYNGDEYDNEKKRLQGRLLKIETGDTVFFAVLQHLKNTSYKMWPITADPIQMVTLEKVLKKHVSETKGRDMKGRLLGGYRFTCIRQKDHKLLPEGFGESLPAKVRAHKYFKAKGVTYDGDFWKENLSPARIPNAEKMEQIFISMSNDKHRGPAIKAFEGGRPGVFTHSTRDSNGTTVFFKIDGVELQMDSNDVDVKAPSFTEGGRNEVWYKKKRSKEQLDQAARLRESLRRGRAPGSSTRSSTLQSEKRTASSTLPSKEPTASSRELARRIAAKLEEARKRKAPTSELLEPPLRF